jgi:acyl-CoA thioesterase
MSRLEELIVQFDKEPLARVLGAKLEHLQDGAAIVSMTVAPHHTVVNGIVQAGIMLSLGDYAGVYAAMSELRFGFTPASGCDSWFSRPVKIGDVMRAEAKVVDRTRNSRIVRVDIWANGKLVSGQTWRYAKPK